MLNTCCQAGEPSQPRPTGSLDIDSLRGAVIIERDVVCGRAGDEPLKLDIVRPKKPSEKPRAVIVYIHGGSWRHGDKSNEIPRILPFAAEGDYFCVSVGYRLWPHATWPAQIHDCKAAIRWLRANREKLNIDPDRIGAWGASAGGHLASLLGTTSDVEKLEGKCGSPGHSTRVKCVVSFSGPTDFTRLVDNNDPKYRTIIRAIEGLLGGPLRQHPEFVREASPLGHVSKDAPPFLLVQGTEDPIVPAEQVTDFHEALRAADVPSTLILLESNIHGSSIRQPDVVQRVRAFFDKHLK
ncbi:MAG: alpha/beta hydrolase [Pirellulaceae bacterium]|nr:alpha/beta hydrolase [Pirellulaceae bacterium]